LFFMLIQMAADLQFHFGNLRIGLPLRFLIQSFAAWMGLISGRCSKTASMARMRPSVSSFVMCFNLQIPEIRTAITAKRKLPSKRPQVYDAKFIGGLPSLLAELGSSIPQRSCFLSISS